MSIPTCKNCGSTTHAYVYPYACSTLQASKTGDKVGTCQWCGETYDKHEVPENYDIVPKMPCLGKKSGFVSKNPELPLVPSTPGETCEPKKVCKRKGCIRGFIPEYVGGHVDCEPCDCPCHKEDCEHPYYDLAMGKDMSAYCGNCNTYLKPSSKPLPAEAEECKHLSGGPGVGNLWWCGDCGKEISVYLPKPTPLGDWQEEFLSKYTLIYDGERTWNADELPHPNDMIKFIKETISQQRSQATQEVREKVEGLMKDADGDLGYAQAVKDALALLK